MRAAKDCDDAHFVTYVISVSVADIVGRETKADLGSGGLWGK
jgi:hypothetical protein